MVTRGEAEFFFVANDPTDEVINHLKIKGYPFHTNFNPKKNDEELFSLGYATPEYIHRVYRGYNEAIRLSSGEIVVLLNSDVCLSYDWLENMLKYLSLKTIVCSHIVERIHPDHGIFPGAYHGEFGSHPDNYRKQEFLSYVEKVKTTGIQLGGAYMPCAFYKDLALKVGFYPEGNLAGTSFDKVIATGDEAFFKKLKQIGVSHVTAMDSIVYHFKEGEMDDFTEKSSVTLNTKPPNTNDFVLPKNESVLPVTLAIENDKPYLTGDLPLVSVITPTYNRASFLDETIQSVLNQDYPRIEYIVLDDGSTDNTKDVLQKYNGRIIWQNHSNMGETRTVNQGITMSSGDILVVVNSDDPILPGAISTIANFMRENPDILVAYPDWNFIGPDSRSFRYRQVPEYDYLYMVKHHHCSVGPGAFIRRQAFNLTGLRDPNYKYVADFEYWLRLGLYGKFARIPKTLATFRVHNDSASVSARGQEMAAEHIRLVKSLYSRNDLPDQVRKVRREAFAWAHWIAGVSAGKNRLLALKHYLLAFFYYPLSLKEILPYWKDAIIQIVPGFIYYPLQFIWGTVRNSVVRLISLLR
jgi:glycosyltransferase involved in cell wall biosynthesis